MKQETPKEIAERYYEDEVSIAAFINGYKLAQEQESKYSVRYMKSEQDFQIERMSKLGINTTGQCFEQMVTSVIQLAERRYSDEDMLKSFLAGVDKESYNGKNFEEWFEQFKNK
jgi:hypothetical protein